MYWTSETEEAPRIIATDPATGEEVAGLFVRPNSEFKLQPNASLAYSVSNDVSPEFLRRYRVENAGQIAFDWEVSGNNFCGALWPSADGNQILTGCGIIVARTDDQETDLQFRGELALSGTVLDAAYQSSTKRWLIIEERNGNKELNIYDGESGRWLFTLNLPEVSAGEPTVPIAVSVNQTTQVATIFASDHETNPLKFALFQRAEVDEIVLDQPPVPIVPRYSAGSVQQQVTLDASQSYDREGQNVEFEWSLVSEPDGSSLSLSPTNQPTLEFTPALAGDYVFSLVTSDGTQQSDTSTVDVRIFEAGQNLQVRLDGTPSDVTYNKVGNQLLYLSTALERLTILDLSTMRERVVELDRIGERLAVTPDGSHAAISHVGLTSLIDLSGTSRRPSDTQAISADYGNIVVDDRQIAFVVPDSTQFVPFFVIDFANDAALENGSSYEGAILRIPPSGGAVYEAQRRLFPNGISRRDITDISQVTVTDNDLTDVRVNGNIWINEESNRVLTGGGDVVTASEVPAQDLVFVESLSPETFVSWADHSQEQQRWAVALENSIRFFSDTSYAQVGEQEIDSL